MSKRLKTAFIFLQIICLVAGGTISLILNLAGYDDLSPNNGLIYSVVVLVFLAFIVVIEIASAIKIHDSTIHTVLTSCALLVCFIFSSDMQELINPARNASFALTAEIVNFVAYAAIVLTHAHLINFLYGLKIKRGVGYAILVYSAAVCVLYGVLTVYGRQYIAYIAYAPAIIYVMVKAYRSLILKRGKDKTFNIVVTILAAATGEQISVFISLFKIGGARPYGIDTTYALLIIILYAAVYVLFLLRTEREALAASEYKLQSERLKSRLMREQINPHFIFNSLVSVKEAYHDDIKKGDLAMNYFSQQLRANVDAMNMDCIPLEKELDNIENYVGLVNMKNGKPVNIIYDIDYTDLSVPVLALQVFVENAVKYAKTEEKEDGAITVSSHKTADGAIIKIADNGTGFDVGTVKNAACGIRNAKTRFSVLLGAEVLVKSILGQGTEIEIIIPDERKTGKESR